MTELIQEILTNKDARNPTHIKALVQASSEYQAWD